jgi:hypothetical protein
MWYGFMQLIRVPKHGFSFLSSSIKHDAYVQGKTGLYVCNVIFDLSVYYSNVGVDRRQRGLRRMRPLEGWDRTFVIRLWLVACGMIVRPRFSLL